MAVQGNGETAKRTGNLMKKEQRFRSARPLKASESYFLKRTITTTSAAAADSFAVLTVPDDMGTVYLRGITLRTTTDTDPTTVFDTVTVGSVALATTESSVAKVAYTDVSGLSGVDIAGDQIVLDADDTTISDDVIEVIVELVVQRVVDLGSESITGTAP